MASNLDVLVGAGIAVLTILLAAGGVAAGTVGLALLRELRELRRERDALLGLPRDYDRRYAERLNESDEVLAMQVLLRLNKRQQNLERERESIDEFRKLIAARLSKKGAADE